MMTPHSAGLLKKKLSQEDQQHAAKNALDQADNVWTGSAAMRER